MNIALRSGINVYNMGLNVNMPLLKSYYNVDLIYFFTKLSIKA